ncbi:MAG: hypothetical protein ACI8RN_002739, partial [Glaciecola sp.]
FLYRCVDGFQKRIDHSPRIGESGHGDIDDVAPNSLLTTRC